MIFPKDKQKSVVTGAANKVKIAEINECDR